jgi:hypothetical protein
MAAKRTKPDIYTAGPNDLDVDRAVKALRNFYGVPPIGGMPSGELDDRIWAKIRG